MIVRPAKISDANHIFELIDEYAQQDIMLFRPVAGIYENLQTFSVAEQDRKIVGCCALEIIWQDLAEIKSLAVHPENKNSGCGKALVRDAEKRAKNLDVPQLFVLTLEPDFFLKSGFRKIEKDKLPMKVWKDCARCPKQEHCDEIAMTKTI